MPTLFVVGTPIGNLRDITERAVDILQSVDLIACEDTRHTATLLQRYGIKTQTVSYHQHSSLQKIDWLIHQLKSGQDIALVTDAGTPGISDPGGILVERVHQHNAAVTTGQSHGPLIALVPVPGPSSVMAALSVCGFPADSFWFLGFLPKKKGRQTFFHELGQRQSNKTPETIVFFESNHRIQQTIKDFLATLGPDTKVCLCRELTKKFEEVWVGTLAEASEQVAMPQKGEFVVAIRLERL